MSGPINLRGFENFWTIVSETLGRKIWTNGSPDFSKIAIELRPGIALVLYLTCVHDGAWWIDYRFQDTDNMPGMHEVGNWHDLTLDAITQAIGVNWQPAQEHNSLRDRFMLAAHIKALRRKAGLSQAELAKLANVGHSTIGDIESMSTTNPRFDTLYRIAKAFGISLKELFEGL